MKYAHRNVVYIYFLNSLLFSLEKVYWALYFLVTNERGMLHILRCWLLYFQLLLHVRKTVGIVYSRSGAYSEIRLGGSNPGYWEGVGGGCCNFRAKHNTYIHRAIPPPRFVYPPWIQLTLLQVYSIHLQIPTEQELVQL